MAPSTINDIVTHACNLLSSTGMREVITACFSLLRKVMAKSRDTEFAPHLQPLVSHVCLICWVLYLHVVHFWFCICRQGMLIFVFCVNL